MFMGVLISLIAIAVLTLVGLVGGSVPGLRYVFGVVLPYIAIATFLVGVVIRIIRWARAPVPFKITTTAGQAKSLDFIRQNKFDSPSNFWGVVGRMALEILFFRSLFRNTKADLKDNSKLVYGEDKWLWAFSLMFHWSFLIIFLRHFRFFTEPIPFFVPLLQGLDGFFEFGLPIVYITNLLIVAGVTYLFFRRIFNEKVKYISLPADYFPLLLIAGIAITGILMRYFFKTDLVGIKELTVGLLSLSPSAPAETISSMFYIHLFFVCSLMIYFPMSKLVHMTGVFFSPTRNMANDNRMKHYENPWDDEFKKEYYALHYHTYDEYEDEFRKFMKAVDLPLEKEEEDVK